MHLKNFSDAVILSNMSIIMLTCTLLNTVQVESQKQNQIQCLFGLLTMIQILTREVCSFCPFKLLNNVHVGCKCSGELEKI